MKKFNTRMTYGKKKRSLAVRILSGMGIALLAVVVLLAGGIAFLSATEFRPQDVEAVELSGASSGTLTAGDGITVVTWNVGYGDLGDNADFFMDGGKGVKTADTARLESNMAGILREIDAVRPDILLIQEIDRDSARSEGMNQVRRIAEHLQGFSCSFANNLKVAFLPYPIPPIGKVDSGIATYSSFAVGSAERIQLPIPFPWPVRMANLKRCLLVSRLPVEGSGRELVLVNLHLEAYDSGEGKTAQTKKLAELLEAEAAKGNYVIAGGDFNQVFSSRDNDAPPAQPGKWAAGWIDVTAFGGNWQFLMDGKVPSCRSLDQAYKGADLDSFQYYLIDGFIVSKNIQVEEAKAVDLGFVVSDHNPVLARLKLNP
jgi:endonuclease/exonuclease/phosphatase family metal-dependent hydrolase